MTDSPPKWMAELESEDIEMLKGKLVFFNTYSCQVEQHYGENRNMDAFVLFSFCRAG